jgi:hypothetical protein
MEPGRFTRQDGSQPSQPPSPEAAMLHFFSVKHFAPESALAVAPPPRLESDIVDADMAARNECECGWFNSSFDLRFGLVVQELPCLALLPAPRH